MPPPTLQRPGTPQPASGAAVCSGPEVQEVDVLFPDLRTDLPQLRLRRHPAQPDVEQPDPWRGDFPACAPLPHGLCQACTRPCKPAFEGTMDLIQGRSLPLPQNIKASPGRFFFAALLLEACLITISASFIFLDFLCPDFSHAQKNQF